MNQNIIIKGVPKKSRSALIVIIIGAVIFLASFYVALYIYILEVKEEQIIMISTLVIL